MTKLSVQLPSVEHIVLGWMGRLERFIARRLPSFPKTYTFFEKKRKKSELLITIRKDRCPPVINTFPKNETSAAGYIEGRQIQDWRS